MDALKKGAKQLAIFAEIQTERNRQDDIWGPQTHPAQTWLMVLGEEIGEVNQAANDAVFQNEPWDCYRQELIQSAAVIVAMIEDFDKRVASLTPIGKISEVEEVKESARG